MHFRTVWRNPNVTWLFQILVCHDDVIMGTIASQITSRMIYSTIYSGADQSKHQSSASLAFVMRIHRGPVNSPHKWPVTRKMFPFDDVIMCQFCADVDNEIMIICLTSSIAAFALISASSDIYKWNPVSAMTLPIMACLRPLTSHTRWY